MDTKGVRIYEYIWIGGDGELRSKTRVVARGIGADDWNYDGSSTGQATTGSSEVVLRPRAFFRNPFPRDSANDRVDSATLVLCDTWLPDGTPHPTNQRALTAEPVFRRGDVADTKPWYGFEQEYFMMDAKTGLPLGFDPAVPQGPFYCSNGAGRAIGRALAEEHLEHCLYAGLTVSGVNAEVAPAQWEFQIGPVEGLAAADQLWIARFILERLSERHGVRISYHPKPLHGDWNGSGCHTNFSTEAMRLPGGLAIIERCVSTLERRHATDIQGYGADNHLRLTGKHETSSMERFTCGIGNRGASVRIGNETLRAGCGYFEDRRPAANMDPYVVSAGLALAAME